MSHRESDPTNFFFAKQGIVLNTHSTFSPYSKHTQSEDDIFGVHKLIVIFQLNCV